MTAWFLTLRVVNWVSLGAMAAAVAWAGWTAVHYWPGITV